MSPRRLNPGRSGLRRAGRAAGLAAIAAFCAALLVLVSVDRAFPSADVLAAARTVHIARLFADEGKYVPNGVSTIAAQPYDLRSSNAYSRSETLNAYFPSSLAGTKKTLPTVFWIHGGGWIGGSALDVASHLKIIASHGYTTIGIDYTLAPHARYPTPLTEIMAALAYVRANAQRLHVDPNSVVLAGDSAGAQLAAQTTELIENPAYARRVGVTTTLQPGSITAVLLFCGVFDWSLAGVHGHFRTYLQDALLQYTGSTRPGTDPKFSTGSAVNYIPAGFPPTFITAGNADPVLEQSYAFADALTAAHIPTDQLFFPKDFRPALAHEYEFRLGTEAGKQAMTRTLSFLAAYTAPALTTH